jgi:hypothetical protein
VIWITHLKDFLRGDLTHCTIAIILQRNIIRDVSPPYPPLVVLSRGLGPGFFIPNSWLRRKPWHGYDLRAGLIRRPRGAVS